MTVHCRAFRIRSAPERAANPATTPEPNPPDLADAIHDRIQAHVFDSHDEVLPRQAVPAVRKRTGGPDTAASGTEHIEAVYRAPLDADGPTVRNTIAASVVADAAWFVLDVHDCHHDPETGVGTGRCPAWERDRTAGTVPDDI